MNKKILFVRTVPYEFNEKTYNVQGFGLGKAFCKLGYDFDFLYFTKKEETIKVLSIIDGHPLRIISKKRIRLCRTGLCFKICKEDFLNQYDFVIVCEYGQYMTYALSKVSNNVVMYSGPYYNMFLLPFMSNIYDWLYAKKINKKIKYKFVKSVLAKEFLEKKGYTNVYTLGVGLDFENFNNNNISMTEKTKNIVDLMTENKCILYVGALSDRKNFPFLLEIYCKLYKERKDLKFVIIGKGKKTYVNSCLKRIPNNIKENIIFVDKLDNSQLAYVYPLAKAFLLPSKLEIFGMVLLEAMFLKAPVISSRNGGSLTLIKQDVTGQIIEEFNSEMWKDAIIKYVNNAEYTSEITKNAKALIEKEYNWNYIAQKMIDIMEGK